MRRFYAPAEQFTAEFVELGIDETRHLRDVLRLRAGERVSVFNGEGREFLTEIAAISKGSARLRVLEAITPAAPRSALDLTLVAAILKGEKFDLVVQKAVELGVDRLVPLITARGDVKPKDTAKRTERWRRIALEAAKQSGRADLMKVSEPVEFMACIARLDAADATLSIMFSERGGVPFPEETAPKGVIALVGPEGGWDDREIESARSAGSRIVTLGGRILRAETAAIAITAILQHRFGDLR